MVGPAGKLTHRLTWLVCVILLAAVGCSQPPAPPQATQAAPTAGAISSRVGLEPAIAVTGPAVPKSWIDSPLHGSTVVLAPVQVVSHSTHPEGISRVELSVDGSVVSVEENPDTKQSLVTTRLTWKPTSPGKHLITLRARSNTGNWGTQASAEVTVKAAGPVRPSGPPQLLEAGPSATPTTTAMPRVVTPSPTPVIASPPVREATDTPVAIETGTPPPVPSDTPVPARMPTETPIPAIPTDTPVPAYTPTSTPVPVHPTFTPTTSPPLPAITLVPRLPILPSATPLPKPGFGSPSVSSGKFYWGDNGCGPKEVTLTVQANSATSVRVHYSLVDQRWTSADMASQRGTWTKTVNSSEVPGYNTSANARFQFYFVATNDAGQTQSPTYSSMVTLSRCVMLK